MIPADIDPSLCSGEPQRERLDDGFSPPPQEPASAGLLPLQRGHLDPVEALSAKSLF